MKKEKFCKNCKWYYKKNNPEYSECHSPKNIDTSKKKGIYLVTGLSDITIWRWLFCDQHRWACWFEAMIIGFCGKSGRWFELKENNEAE